MSRHPYTYAADMLRLAASDPNDPCAPCTVSRAQASKIRQCFAKVLGMDDAELAERLSTAYQDDVLRPLMLSAEETPAPAL